MKQHEFQPETTPKPADQLWRQSDFRNEYEHLPSGVEFIRDQVKINLRLAAAGDAVHQVY